MCFSVAPIEKLHHDEGAAIFLADVVNGADVGVIESGSGLRLALKTAQGLRIAGNFVGQKLEGNETMQAGIFGLVNDAHAAAAQLFDDPVVGDGLADHCKSATSVGMQSYWALRRFVKQWG